MLNSQRCLCMKMCTFQKQNLSQMNCLLLGKKNNQQNPQIKTNEISHLAVLSLFIGLEPAVGLGIGFQHIIAVPRLQMT